MNVLLNEMYSGFSQALESLKSPGMIAQRRLLGVWHEKSCGIEAKEGMEWKEWKQRKEWKECHIHNGILL